MSPAHRFAAVNAIALVYFLAPSVAWLAGGPVAAEAPEIPQEAVEEAARSFQSVRYCDYSGEILSGGNTFVSVNVERRNTVPEERAE